MIATTTGIFGTDKYKATFSTAVTPDAIVDEYLRDKGTLKQQHDILVHATAAGAPTALIEKRFAFIRDELKKFADQWKNYYAIALGQGRSELDAIKAANHIFDAAFINASAAADSYLPLPMVNDVKSMKLPSGLKSDSETLAEAITNAMKPK